MSSGPIAQATIKVVPDLTGFRAELQRAINQAVSGVTVPPVGPGGPGGAGGGAGGAAADKAVKGAKEATKASQALRGALIGVSRVTPVTVFGLGLYGTAGIGVALAIRNAVVSTAQFEKQLNTLQAITRISDDELDGIRQTSVELGADVRLAAISAADAAVAMTELAKAGLSVKDTLAAARGVLELAGAAEISAGEAAKFVATELNAFNLAGTEAVRVVDLLASASIAAQGEITDFGNAFQQVSAVAAQAGLTVEQTTAALTLLAKAGITSSDAGTSLRTFLLRLIPTTKQAGEFVKVLGVQLDGTKTEGEQLADVIEQYRAALLLLNPIQRTNVLNQIFGQDAIRAASVLLTQNVGELDRQIDALNNAGVAAELNAAKAEGLSGAWAGLKSTLETTGIQLGSVASGPLEAIVRKINDFVIDVGTATGAVSDLVTVLGDLKPVQLTIEVVATGFDALPGFVQKALGITALGFAVPGVGQAAAAVAGFEALVPTKTPPVTTPDLISPSLIADYKKAVKAKNKKAIKEAAAAIKESFTGINPQFGLQSFEATTLDQQEQLFDKTFGKASRIQAQSDGTFQKKVQALIDKQSGAGGDTTDKIDFDITAPNKLRVNLLQAQIKGSLQSELVADKAIRDYFEARLERAKEGTPRYLKILTALQTADAAVEAVQGQIDSDREAANKRREDAAKKRRQAAVELAKSQIDLRNEILATRLSAAELTDTNADNIRIYNLQISEAESRIDKQKKLAAKAKQGSQVQIDALLAIQKDIQRINGIRASIKGLQDKDKDKGGFTLNELFQESVDQLNEFGSNVSTSVTTGGSARAAVAGGILAQRPRDAGDKLARINDMQLAEQARGNALLADILAAVSSSGALPKSPSTTVDKSHAGESAFERARRLGQTTRPF